jgi:hypothetical protein
MMETYRSIFSQRLQLARDRPVPLNHIGYPSNHHINHINRIILTQEAFIMPRSSASSGTKRDWGNTQFVNYRLNAQEKVKFRTYMEQSTDELSLILATFISAGHKVSLTWDDENKCYIASATCKNPKSANLDCCLSSRAPDWFEALMLNPFKSDVLMGGNAWKAESGEDNFG